MTPLLAAATALPVSLPALGGLLGIAGVLAGAVAVFLAGPPLLIQLARILAVLGLCTGAVGTLGELMQAGFRADPTRRGGSGSLLASAGMVLLAFGAARVAERRRLERRRARQRQLTPR